jgi:hypothetical protein
MDRLGSEIAVPFFRRLLSEVINPLVTVGFELGELLELRPQDEFRTPEPEAHEELMRRPGFRCLRAISGAAV